MNRTVKSWLWLGLPVFAALVVVVLLAVPLAPGRWLGALICGALTAGLAMLCRWWYKSPRWPRGEYGSPEYCLMWTVILVGGSTTSLCFLPDLYPPLIPLTAAALVFFLATMARISRIRPGEMYGVLVFDGWSHTRINSNDETLALEEFDVRDHEGKLRSPSRKERKARIGHFGADYAFALWPWRLQPWSAKGLVLDFLGLEGLTKDHAKVFADLALTIMWGPYLGPAIARLQERFTRRLPDGSEKMFLKVDPGNEDDSLRLYLEPVVHGAFLEVIQKRDFRTLLSDVESIQGELLSSLGRSIMHNIGLVDPTGGGNGFAARAFDLRVERLLPAEGTELNKAIDANIVAQRRREARMTEAKGEAAYQGTLARVEAFKTRRVGEATAAAAKAVLDAETEGVKDQMDKLRGRKGVSNAAVLEGMNIRRAAQAGGTVIIIPGLADAVEAFAQKKEAEE